MNKEQHDALLKAIKNIGAAIDAEFRRKARTINDRWH